MNKNREIKSIPIVGLDTSSPDNMAAEGSCSTLHNLRIHNNAWQAIMPQKTIASIPTNGTINILYHHPNCPDNLYIAAFAKEGVSSIGLIDTTLPSAKDIINNAIILWKDVGYYGRSFLVKHFGKVLIIVFDNKIRYFVWNELESTYSEYTTPQPASISEGYAYGDAVGAGYVAYTNLSEEGEAYDIWRIYDIENNVEERAVSEENSNMWWGELCYLVCYKMTDGTIVSPSELRILCSDTEEDREWVFAKIEMHKATIDHPNAWCLVAKDHAYNGVPEDRAPIPTNRLRKCLPTITVALPDGIKNNPLVDRVAIYATRINTIYDYIKLNNNRSDFFGTLRISTENQSNYFRLADINTKQGLSIMNVYADNRLPEQPFYLVEEKQIQDIDGDWIVSLGYDKLKNITSQVDIYTPNQSLHKIVPTTLYDYNERLHMADLATEFFEGYNNIVPFNTGASTTPFYQVILNNDCVVQKNLTPITGENNIDFLVRGGIISYPAAQAQELRLYKSTATSSNTLVAYKVFKLTPAYANGFAYHVFPPTVASKYQVGDNYSDMTNYVKYKANPIEREPNRIQVSAAGNCLNLPFDTSYKVGDAETHIKAMDTVSEMLADSRFGETPLYVFTDNGIWVAIVGSGEVVYSNWAVINFDRITLNRTIAANGVVFYVTERGIHALQGRKATLISHPIENPNKTQPRDYKDLWLNHKYNELIVDTMGDYGIMSFIYSLDNGKWYSKDYQGRKINGNILVKENADSTISIHDSEQDDIYYTNTLAQVTIKTRPFELAPMRFSRIDSLWVRILNNVNSGDINILIDGANTPTPNKWVRLREVTTAERELGVIRGVPSSARWYRVTLIVMASQQMTLTHFDIEFYLKYLRRLR